MALRHRLQQWWLFNRWYLRSKRPPWDTGITPPELMAFIHSHPVGKALDLGCGTGTNAITLAQHGWEVMGVDFAVQAIQTARQRAKHSGHAIAFRLGDVSNLSGISGSFSLIYDIGCFHALDAIGRARYAAWVGRLLEQNGTFLLYAQFRPDETRSDFGLMDRDLNVFAPKLKLVQRDDGTDTASHRKSAWITFVRQ